MIKEEFTEFKSSPTNHHHTFWSYLYHDYRIISTGNVSKNFTRTRENIISGVAGSCCFGQKLETQESLGVEKLGTVSGNCCNRLFDGFWSQRLGKAHLENSRVQRWVQWISSHWSHSSHFLWFGIMLYHIIYHHIPIGSMVLVYMLTWLGYIELLMGSNLTIYSSTIDPSWRISLLPCFFHGPLGHLLAEFKDKASDAGDVHKIWRVDWSVELHQLISYISCISWSVDELMSWIHYDQCHYDHWFELS